MKRWSLNARSEGRSGRSLGKKVWRDYLYAEVFQGNQFEEPALPRGVGYLIDFEVDWVASESPRFPSLVGLIAHHR